jgi:hypothetical protein
MGRLNNQLLRMPQTPGMRSFLNANLILMNCSPSLDHAAIRCEILW